MIGRVADPADNLAVRGCSAHRCGSDQRRKNTRAACQYAVLPRPLPARWSRYAACRSALADAVTGGIELGFHVGGGQVDVAGGGVDVGVASSACITARSTPASARAVPKV